MIFPILFAMSLQSAAQAGDAIGESPFIRDINAYESCVTAQALIFEQANEGVAETVDAAFAGCKDERATLYFTMEENKKKNGKEFDHAWAERFIVTLIDEPLRDEMTVLLMKIRAGVR